MAEHITCHHIAPMYIHTCICVCVCACAFNKWVEHPFKHISKPIIVLYYLYTFFASIFAMWDYVYISFTKVTWHALKR